MKEDTEDIEHSTGNHNTTDAPNGRAYKKTRQERHRKTDERHDAMVYPRHSIETKLGMDTVRHLVSEECVTEPAREKVAAMCFSTDFHEIRHELEMTWEMVGKQTSEQPLSLAGLADVREWLSRLKTEGSHIDAEEFSKLRTSLKIIAETRKQFSEADCPYPILHELCLNLHDVIPIIRHIDRVLTDTGTVKDDASAELADIRKKKSTIQNRISGAIRRVLSAAVTNGLLEADTQPSVRNGRLVLPVPAMHKRAISGIVHDESATGRTFYIEPAEVVELNNEQRQLDIEEIHEITRILTQLANELRPTLPDTLKSFEVLYHLDFVHAKAIFALKTNCQLPRLDNRCQMQWHDACHPVLKINLEKKGRSIVPLNLDLDKDTARILIISGPNAGGKSVALKTVGINQYMLQCGLLPAMDRNSRAGIFDGIFVDIGDDQSLEDDLSTYSSHLRNMKFMLSHATSQSLILIDEFGGGTEPQIGGAIAQALLTAFNDRGVWGVVTTHFQNLKQMGQETPGIMNGSMMYDRTLMQPTFRLLSGTPGSSFAVEIASRIGLPRYIIANVERIVGSEYFNIDKYLQDILRDRRYWENKRYEIKKREKHLEEVITGYEENAERLRSQRRTLLEDAKKEAQDIIASSNAAVERAIRTIRETQADKEATREARATLEREKKAIAERHDDEPQELKKATKRKNKKQPVTQVSVEKAIEAGDNVLLDNQGTPGNVMEVHNGTATVSFGAMKVTVPVNRLSRTLRKASPATANRSSASTSLTAEASRQRQLAFKTEIDVRGMRADEAIQAVTYFIDDALQFGVTRVRILHGTGTGALRMAIRQYLDQADGVKAYRDEDVRMGGAGITVVDLS